MARLFARIGLAVVACICASAGAPEFHSWTMARTNGLEVYSQAGAERARETLEHFERLREFFNRNELIRVPANSAPPPLRILTFRSANEYESFRFRPNANAYYVASENHAYIVMPESESTEFATSAHEYAHYFLHAAGLKLPAWMNEGLAEVFSAVHNDESRVHGWRNLIRPNASSGS